MPRRGMATRLNAGKGLSTNQANSIMRTATMCSRQGGRRTTPALATTALPVATTLLAGEERPNEIKPEQGVEHGRPRESDASAYAPAGVRRNDCGYREEAQPRILRTRCSRALGVIRFQLGSCRLVVFFQPGVELRAHSLQDDPVRLLEGIALLVHPLAD